MSRPINFRVWDKQEREWKKTERLNGKRVIIVPEDDSRYVLMQFTGLHDRQGTDIYEGDVLKWTADDGSESVEIYDVHYQAPSFYVRLSSHPDWIGGNNPLTDPDVFEVIGNIYESAELLTGAAVV